jgi:hypothetical protein
MYSMKAFFTTLVFCLLAVMAMAGSEIAGGGEKNGQTPASSPFYFDEQKVSEATEGLANLEAYVNENEATLEVLEAENSELIEGLNLDRNANISAFGPAVEGPAGVPSFFWGLCLGAIGLLIVYIVTEDNDELKKALWGCLVAAGVYVLFYVIYFVAIGATWWWA